MSGITLLTFIRFSLQLIVAELFFLKGRPRKERFLIRVCLTVAGYILVGGVYHMVLNEWMPDTPVTQVVYFFGLFVLTMAGMLCCYDLMLIEVLFAGTGGYAAEHIAYMVARILRYVCRVSEEDILVDNLIFRCLIYLLVYVVIYYVVIYPNKDKGEFRSRDMRLVQMMLVVLFGAIILSVFTSDKGIIGNSLILSEIICPLYSMLCCALVLLMEFYVLRENRLNHEKEAMEQMLQMARTQQKSSKEAIDIINIKCHDLKHQMKVLSKLEDPDERNEYLEEMKKAVSIYDATYHTGCDALDYLLREKSLLCDEYGIIFSCMADGEAINFINTTDIYALMGNAMDNAIEGASGADKEQRIISLRIQRRSSMVVVHLENTCNQLPVFVKGLPVTTKQDKNYHGFGVKSIVYIVEKYHGQVQMKAENHKFYLDIMFPVLK